MKRIHFSENIYTTIFFIEMERIGFDTKYDLYRAIYCQLLTIVTQISHSLL